MNCDLTHTVLINGSYHGTYYSYAAVNAVREMNQDKDIKFEVYTKRTVNLNGKIIETNVK